MSSSKSNEPNLLQSIFLQNDQELLGAIAKDGQIRRGGGSYGTIDCMRP